MAITINSKFVKFNYVKYRTVEGQEGPQPYVREDIAEILAAIVDYGAIAFISGYDNKLPWPDGNATEYMPDDPQILSGNVIFAQGKWFGTSKASLEDALGDSNIIEKLKTELNISTLESTVGKKVDKTDIVQSTGTSETALMSQNAVSDALSTKVDKTELASYATKEYVQTNAPNETKDSIEEKLGAWLEEDGGEVDGEVYTKVESDARYYEKQVTDTLLTDKVSKSDIVQSTGTNTTAVMSQKAVSDIVDELERKVTNAADGEDITVIEENGTSKLRFADRNYEPLNDSGKGYKILRKNIQTIDRVRKNILTKEMISEPNTVYEIRYDFDLDGAEITIPDGCILKFNGGRLLNGTIKGSKLDTNEVYYPEQFGANGIDDTVAIQNCVTLAKYINMSGAYKVHSDKRLSLIEECAISVPSNTNIELNGTIELITDNKSHSIVFYILNQKNIAIHGSGIVIGDRDSNTLPSGEWGYGIGIFGSENIQVSGLTLHSFFGDGIFVGPYYDKGLSKYIHPTNIKLEGLEIFKNRRQGISVQDGSSIYIYNSVIYDIEGTSPHSCIDIEAVANNDRLIKDVIIKGCILNNEGSKALFVIGSENVLISSCDVYGEIYINDLAYYDKEDIPRIKLCSVKMQDVHSKDILGCSIDIKLDHCEFGNLYLHGQSPYDNLHRDSFIIEANYCAFAKIYDNTHTYNGTLNFYNCKIIADDCNNSGFITLQKRANNKINKLNLFNCYLRAGNFYTNTGMINAVSYSCDSCTFEYDRQWEIYGTYYNCIFKYSRADNTDCFVVNRAKGITKLYNCILWNTSNTDIYPFRANTINSRIDAYNVKTINCNNTIFKSLGVVNVYNLINMSESELVSKYKIRGKSNERPFPDYKGFCYYDTDFNMPVWSTEGRKPSSTISVESVSEIEEQTTSFIVKTYDSKEHIISINITNNMTKDDLLLAIYNSIIASSSLMTSTYKPIVSLLESSVVISGQDNTSGNISIESLPSINGISWSVNNIGGVANKWLDAFGNNIDAKKFGKFSDKPDTSTGIKVGFSYFCTDRKTTEGNSNGILIYYKGDGVWVDALGRVVV